MARLEPTSRVSLSQTRVDDRRVLSGTIFINHNGLGSWRDALKEYDLTRRSTTDHAAVEVVATNAALVREATEPGHFAQMMVGLIPRTAKKEDRHDPLSETAFRLPGNGCDVSQGAPTARQRLSKARVRGARHRSFLTQSSFRYR
jgi:hypothetical protein